MKYLLFLFLIPTLSFAQTKLKGFNTISIGPEYMIGESDIAYGIHVSGNALISKGSSIGAEISYTKINGLGGAYVPVSLKFTTLINQDRTKISPMLVIQPGYGLYNNPSSYHSTEEVHTTGGPTIFSGLGIMFPSKTSSRAFIIAGYSSYGLKFGNVTKRFETVALRLGFTIE